MGLLTGSLSYASDQKQKNVIDNTEILLNSSTGKAYGIGSVARTTNNTVAMISMSDTKRKYCAPVIASDGTAMIKLLKIDLQKMQQVKIVWFLDNQEILDYRITTSTSPYLDKRFLSSMGSTKIAKFNEIGEHTVKVVVKNSFNNILAQDEKSYEIVACDGQSLTFGNPSSQCLGVAPDEIPSYFKGDGSGSTHGDWTDESGISISSNIPEGSFNAVYYIPPMLLNPILNTPGFHFLRFDAPANPNSGSFVSNTIIFNIQSCASGVLDHFEFSTISSQAVGVPFNVTITAKDASGNRVQDFNGNVNLTSAQGGVSPTSVDLVNGRCTVSVKMYDRGKKNHLNANWYDAYGNSENFDVTGGKTCSNSFEGEVVDLQGDVVAGAHDPRNQDDRDLTRKFCINGAGQYYGLTVD